MTNVDPRMKEFHEYLQGQLGHIKALLQDDTKITLIIRRADKAAPERAIFLTEETDVTVPVAIMQELHAKVVRGDPLPVPPVPPVEAMSPELAESIARQVDATLNGDAVEDAASKRWGFGLLMFEHGQVGPQSVVYISNAEREFMRAALRKWLEDDEAGVDLRNASMQGNA